MEASPGQSQVELTAFNDDNDQDYQSLPQADTGRAAWTFLASCFVLEGLVWG